MKPIKNIINFKSNLTKVVMVDDYEVWLVGDKTVACGKKGSVKFIDLVNELTKYTSDELDKIFDGKYDEEENKIKDMVI